ncbi:MAG: hypothetical protein KDB24_06200, partial [Microthrixaceae bacterium]|nr:hypothetical protein [Microthrixaceae bacterium]
AADAMDKVNPAYIPRNHLVAEALAAATEGDLDPFDRLLGVVTRPFDTDGVDPAYGQPADDEFARRFRTYCGT